MATDRVLADTDEDTLDLTDRGTKRKAAEIEDKSPYEELDIKQATINQYEEDHKYVKRCIYRGLYEWKEENQKETAETLTGRVFAALRKVNHQNIIDEICSDYKIEVKEEIMDTTETELEHEKEECDIGGTETDDTGQISDVDEDEDCNRMDVDMSDDESAASRDDEVDMRSYQLELASNASKGNNAVVLAGTGSGKTRIAIYLMKRHTDANPNAKIVFMARTIPLVAQQFNAIRKIMPERYKSKIFKTSGEDLNSGEFHLTLKNEQFNIAVMTPQKLVNSFKESHISISQLSMLVFDECHHTKKDNPYNIIMKFYREVKRRKTEKTPQIIGLSATYGTDNARTDEDALQSLLNLMARMDVKTLSTVERYKEEYEKHVVIPESRTVPMQARAIDPIKDKIDSAMQVIEEDLKLSELDTWGEDTRKLLEYIPEDRNEMKYYNWVQRVKNIAERMLKDHPDDGRFALACCAHLKMYFEALELNRILNPSDVSMILLCNLDSQYFTRSEECQTKEEKKLVDIFKNLRKDVKQLLLKGEVENPNVTNIVQIVKDIFQEKGYDSRFIIFVQSRRTAVLLSNLLNTKQSLKCTFLTGHGKSTNDGLSQDEQRLVMARLNRGDVHGIVATSVAEEGLDIANCNVVIRYNNVGNEISRIQTRGRSRKAGGRYIVIADSRNAQREAVNIEREYLMKEAVEKFLKMPEKIVLSRLDSAQKEILEKEQIEDMKRQSITDSKSDEEFDMMCGFCGTFTLSSKGIRCYKGNHYVVVDSSFYKNVNWKPHKKPVNYDGINKTHKVDGKCCENDWGIGCMILNTKCVVLKLSSFLINGERYKKWKNVPYRVKAFNEIEDVKQLMELHL